MTRRFVAALLAATLLNSCVNLDPAVPKVVEARSASDSPLAAMARTQLEGPFRIDAVVYKPKLLPLASFFRKLSRGELKQAVAAARLRSTPANFDDAALKTLLKRGFIPVLVRVTNESASPADLRKTRLVLSDGRRALAPISNGELPENFKSFDPKAVAANTYNVTVTIVGVAVLLAVVAGLIYVERNDQFAFPAMPDSWNESLSEALDRGVFNPTIKTTGVDYNNLLFSAGTLRPGETARGLLFFKGKGVDWSLLKLEASPL